MNALQRCQSLFEQRKFKERRPKYIDEIISVLIFVILLGGLIFGGFLLLRCLSKRQEHVKQSKDKEEAATKNPKAKKIAPVVKQADETQSIEEIPIVEQNVTPKQATRTSIITFLSRRTCQ
jgi:di/tricarboxylate transporter